MSAETLRQPRLDYQQRGKPVRTGRIRFRRARQLLALLAEDDLDLATSILRRLELADYVTMHAKTGAEALDMARKSPPDIVILDRMLPEGDGLSLLRQWREEGLIAPVLLLTALDGIDERVEGLDAGADDYVGKPFAFSELIARVNALARRASTIQAQTRIEHGPIQLDLLKREVLCHGRPVALQPREFHLLEELARDAGRTVTRQMLLERVWGLRFDPRTNIVESHMSRLRAKLAASGAENLIETVRREGYRMAACDRPTGA